MDNRPIGVFDSGLGGLSVLNMALRALPDEHFIYLGDNAHAPYGTKTEEEIRELTLSMANRLLEQNIKALLIACNTATSAAAATLRSQWIIPIVAMEPALKPAHLLHEQGQILVLATPATLRLPKFALLMQKYGQGAVPVPLTGVVELVEASLYDSPEMDKRLHELLSPFLGKPIDAVVLGCTHYVFARASLRRVLGPDIPLVDGNAGTVRQLGRILQDNGLLSCGPGKLEMHTTGDENRLLPLMKHLVFMDLPL